MTICPCLLKNQIMPPVKLCPKFSMNYMLAIIVIVGWMVNSLSPIQSILRTMDTLGTGLCPLFGGYPYLKCLPHFDLE